MLPGVERGKVEGLYFVPIIYPIVGVVAFIALMIFAVWFSVKYPCEPNQEQPAVKAVQMEG